MKTIKRTLAIILAVAVIAVSNVIPVSATSTSFTDVKTTSWYYSYVNKLIVLKITSGIGNNKYGPDNSVTKAEFVTFLCKATARAQEDGYTYSDTKTHWAKEYISAAVTANIIDQGTTFNPNKAITRQEAVEMLCRALGLQENTTMATPYVDAKTDIGYSNEAYKEYLMQGSIVNNERYFKPSSSITRAETAAVIVNLVDYNANPESYKAGKKAEISVKEQKDNAAKEEAEKYQEWLDSMDEGVSAELMKNTTYIHESKNLYESYKKTMDFIYSDGCKYWMDKLSIKTNDDLVEMYLSYARKAMQISCNYSYKDTNVLIENLKQVFSYNFNYATTPKYIQDIKNNKLIMESQFYSGKGLITDSKIQQPAVRGTLKYRYLLGTKLPTGKKLNTWYEEDILITFYYESTGLKVHYWTEISSTREVL